MMGNKFSKNTGRDFETSVIYGTYRVDLHDCEWTQGTEEAYLLAYLHLSMAWNISFIMYTLNLSTVAAVCLCNCYKSQSPSTPVLRFSVCCITAWHIFKKPIKEGFHTFQKWFLLLEAVSDHFSETLELRSLFFLMAVMEIDLLNLRISLHIGYIPLGIGYIPSDQSKVSLLYQDTDIYIRIQIHVVNAFSCTVLSCTTVFIVLYMYLLFVFLRNWSSTWKK